MPSSSYVVKQRLKAIVRFILVQRRKHIHEVLLLVSSKLKSMKFFARQFVKQAEQRLWLQRACKAVCSGLRPEAEPCWRRVRKRLKCALGKVSDIREFSSHTLFFGNCLQLHLYSMGMGFI